MTIKERFQAFGQSLRRIPTGWILPVLVASYPIVYLYSQNVQIVSSSQLVLPLSIAWAGSLILWAIFSLITKDTKKGGIISAVFVVFFFAYGHLFDWATSISALEIRHRHFLPIILFIAGYIGYFIAVTKKPELFKNVFKVSCVAVAFLLVVNIVPIIPVELQKSQMGIHQSSNASGTTPGRTDSVADYPDIYYIVLDEYASFETLETVWGYDNSEFKDFLESRGFFVAEKSRTHSLDTLHIMASILNMKYIEQDADTLEKFSLINDNEVMRLLSTKGYTTVAIDGIKVPYGNKESIKSDYYFDPRELTTDSYIFSTYDEFSILTLDNTMVGPFQFVFEPNIRDTMDKHRVSRHNEFGQITRLFDIRSPKFVYAHMMLPHTPFIFDKDGNAIDSKDKANYRDKSIYLEQLIFTTRKAEETVEALLKQYPESNPPIIIIQSDHGFRYLHDGVEEYMPKNESYKVLNAFLLPGYDYTTIEDDIPPIEVLPLIIEHYINSMTSQPEDYHEFPQAE